MKALQFVKTIGADIKQSRIDMVKPNKIKISRSMLNFLLDFLNQEFKQHLESSILKLGDPFQIILVLMSLILNKVHKQNLYKDLSGEIANVSFSLLEIFNEDDN